VVEPVVFRSMLLNWLKSSTASARQRDRRIASGHSDAVSALPRRVRETSTVTDWADGLTTIALRWRSGTQSIRDLFTESAPPESCSADEFKAAVTARLAKRPQLIDAWQTYSYDKRTSPSPYLDGLEVGHYDGGREDVANHATPTDACTDFVYRETQWVLHRRRAR
jgi:hypothetical protein